MVGQQQDITPELAPRAAVPEHAAEGVHRAFDPRAEDWPDDRAVEHRERIGRKVPAVQRGDAHVADLHRPLADGNLQPSVRSRLHPGQRRGFAEEPAGGQRLTMDRSRRIEPGLGEELADDAAHERGLPLAERLEPPHEGEVQHAEEDESVKDVLAGLYVCRVVGRGEQVAAEETECKPQQRRRVDDHEQRPHHPSQAGDARQLPAHPA